MNQGLPTSKSSAHKQRRVKESKRKNPELSSATTAAKTLPCGRPTPAVHSSTLDDESLFEDLIKQLEAYVTKKGLNRSEVRAKVLRTIIVEARHFRPQDLLNRIRVRFPEVGRATVYRTLPILVACGILEEGPTDPDGQNLYELKNTQHHDHIVCLDCSRIFEFNDPTIEKRQDVVSKHMGFVPKSHRHVIYAKCKYLTT